MRRRFNISILIGTFIVGFLCQIACAEHNCLRPLMLSPTTKQIFYSWKEVETMMLASGLSTISSPILARRLDSKQLRADGVPDHKIRMEMDKVWGASFEYRTESVAEAGKVLKRNYRVQGLMEAEGSTIYYYSIAIHSMAQGFINLGDFAELRYSISFNSPRTSLYLNMLSKRKIVPFEIEISGEILKGADFTVLDQNTATLVLTQDALTELVTKLKDEQLLEGERADQANNKGEITLQLKVKEPLISSMGFLLFDEINMRLPFQLIILSETNSKAGIILGRLTSEAQVLEKGDQDTGL